MQRKVKEEDLKMLVKLSEKLLLNFIILECSSVCHCKRNIRKPYLLALLKVTTKGLDHIRS